MYLGVVCVRERLNKRILIVFVFGNVMTQARDDDLVTVFHLTICLRMVLK